MGPRRFTAITSRLFATGRKRKRPKGERLMPIKIFFKNQKTGKEFQVISINKDKTKITIKGEYATITEDYDPEKIKKLGYVMIKREVPEDAEVA
jgi:hypothetical protein